jgi:hypothetical protein
VYGKKYRTATGERADKERLQIDRRYHLHFWSKKQRSVLLLSVKPSNRFRDITSRVHRAEKKLQIDPITDF